MSPKTQSHPSVSLRIFALNSKFYLLVKKNRKTLDETKSADWKYIELR